MECLDILQNECEDGGDARESQGFLIYWYNTKPSPLGMFLHISSRKLSPKSEKLGFGAQSGSLVSPFGITFVILLW